MIPLTSITQALNITYTVNQSAKTVVLKLNTKPVASFTVQNEIFAGIRSSIQRKAAPQAACPLSMSSGQDVRIPLISLEYTR